MASLGKMAKDEAAKVLAQRKLAQPSRKVWQQPAALDNYKSGRDRKN